LTILSLGATAICSRDSSNSRPTKRVPGIIDVRRDNAMAKKVTPISEGKNIRERAKTYVNKKIDEEALKRELFGEEITQQNFNPVVTNPSDTDGSKDIFGGLPPAQPFSHPVVLSNPNSGGTSWNSANAAMLEERKLRALIKKKDLMGLIRYMLCYSDGLRDVYFHYNANKDFCLIKLKSMNPEDKCIRLNGDGTWDIYDPIDKAPLAQLPHVSE
jgi:hypothetical protein